MKATSPSASASSTSTTDATPVTQSRIVDVCLVRRPPDPVRNQSETKSNRIMKTLELCSRCIMQLLLAACAAAFCLKLCTGCTYLKAVHNEAKPALAVALKDAYALGGATAVSNKIEQLVVDGKVTPAQAAQLHILAQALFDRAVERLEAEDFEAALTPTNAPAVQ